MHSLEAAIVALTEAIRAVDAPACDGADVVHEATRALVAAWLRERTITPALFATIADVFRAAEHAEPDVERRSALVERRHQALLAAMEATAEYRAAVRDGRAPSRDEWREDGRGGARTSRDAVQA